MTPDIIYQHVLVIYKYVTFKSIYIPNQAEEKGSKKIKCIATMLRKRTNYLQKYTNIQLYKRYIITIFITLTNHYVIAIVLVTLEKS